MDYRKTFFSNNPPVIHNNYFCAYCGKLVNKENITVDHLYPIGAVKKDPKLQKKLKRKGIKDINDKKNLVPACRTCNKKKSANLGIWIIKGKIGKHQFLWIIRHLIRLIIIYKFIVIFLI